MFDGVIKFINLVYSCELLSSMSFVFFLNFESQDEIYIELEKW